MFLEDVFELKNSFLNYIETRVENSSISGNTLGERLFDFSQESSEHENTYFSLELLESALYRILSEEKPYVSQESIKYFSEWKLNSKILQILSNNYPIIYEYAIQLDSFRKKLLIKLLNN